jgi:hypothetical protein
MPAYVTREEFEARVGVLEREVEGEKLVTRHILEQTRRNGDDLATIKRQLDGSTSRDSCRRSTAFDQKVDLLDRTVKDLARSLPVIVAETMREVQREGK